MCHHDIDISTWKKYLRRQMGCGRSYLEAGLLMWKSHESFWAYQTAKIIFKVLLTLALFLAGVVFHYPVLFLLGIAVTFYPFFKLPYFMRVFRISLAEALIYAFHCSIVIWPQFTGILGSIRKK